MHTYSAKSLTELRECLLGLSERLGAECEDEDLAFDIRLTFCELVSNILKYSREKRAEFWLERTECEIWLFVRGDVRVLPHSVCPPASEERGRGLYLIHELPRFIGCERGEGFVKVRLARTE